VKNRRVTETGKQVVSVSIPIQHVAEVLGVLTLEAGDVDAIIARERAALIPFILIAVGVTLLSSLLLSILVAQPMLRLARPPTGCGCLGPAPSPCRTCRGARTRSATCPAASRT